MKKTGLADSPFFITPPAKKEHRSLPSSSEPLGNKKRGKRKDPIRKPRQMVQTHNRDTTIPSNHDTKQPRYHDTIVELVRRAVKDYGKEAATHRFTLGEKKAIADVIYAYKGRGVKTSENEVTRIAINFVLNDYRENGKNSVLDRILKALNS